VANVVGIITGTVPAQIPALPEEDVGEMICQHCGVKMRVIQKIPGPEGAGPGSARQLRCPKCKVKLFTVEEEISEQTYRRSQSKYERDRRKVRG
jgi:hypothetical protein